MRRALSVLFLGLMMASCNNTSLNEAEKQLVGQWFNPYTYESTGELKGFDFKKDGTCEMVGVPSIKLDTWKVQGDTLIVQGKELDKDGSTWSDYYTAERIDYMNNDSLRVVAQERPFKLTFLYMKLDCIKKHFKAGSPKED